VRDRRSDRGCGGLASDREASRDGWGLGIGRFGGWSAGAGGGAALTCER
jgi:hypothetical protein